MNDCAPVASASSWPAFTHDDARATLATVHLWTQMVGKTRLALSPRENHYWHVPLYLTSRGLTTSPMPHRSGTIEIAFDFIDHRLVAQTSEGATAALPLSPRPVAEFYRDYRALLRELDVHAKIWPVPTELPDPVRFDADREHASYDRAVMESYWSILVQVDRVMKRFRGRFLGKCSPAHFWWGGFDHACTRFSGRVAPQHPGGFPGLADHVTRESYSHECISAGFWPGTPGTSVNTPTFYAYAYPEPAGCPEASVSPRGAAYHFELREWILPYDSVRTAADPDAELLEFFQSTYDAASKLGGWDPALERAKTAR
jgi:hypothetical protein